MLRFFIILLLLSALSCPVVATAANLSDRVQEHQLENGLTVLLLERHSSPTVAAYISFKVGSVNENSEQRGIAHMLEHMLFKGTNTLGTRDYESEQPLLKKIEEVGEKITRLNFQPDADEQELKRLRERLQLLQQEHRDYVVKDEFARIYAEHGGVGFNAFTSKDQTSYLINLPANKLELWAAIESDRLKNAVFREFFTEREVVQEERRRAVDINPGGKLYENLLATAYQVHPYRHPIIGWHSDIQGYSLPQIRDFFHRYYTPDNMVITLVGAFNSADTLALVERYFGELPASSDTTLITDKEPQQQGERRVHVNFDAEPRMMVAYHKPTAPHADDYAFDILARALAHGRTSRLYQSLVIDRQLVSDVGVFSAPGSRYDNLFIISLYPRRDVTLATIEHALDEEMQRLVADPLTEADIEKARHQMMTLMLRGMRTNSGLARMLSSFEILGDWKYLVEYEDRLNAVDTQDLTGIARRYLQRSNRTVAILSRGGDQ
ncbi:MAG: pitrilysin family protein [Pelovirga sp.]